MYKFTRLYRFYLTFLFFGIGISTFAQPSYPKNLFVPPVDFPMLLSGTFAELRSNHFHSGIDIKTGGVEGKNINAAAGGYISRIRVSPYGFGKAIYIQHPNGYSTVYGHLRNFMPEIEKWVKSEQYRLQRFDVDLFPDKEMFPVQQGKQIAWSGNSGSSQGPHLHFEIRDSRTEEPMDPIQFGFDVKDFTRPTLNGFRIYPANNTSTVNGSNRPFQAELSGWGTDYLLKPLDAISVSGDVYFGLEAFDLLNGASNKNGINLVQVFVDSILQFHWEANKFSFAETRYLNSLIDYDTYYHSGKRYFLTRVAPQNKLSMYKTPSTGGIIKTKAGKSQKIKIILADGKRNESELNFIIKGVAGPTVVADKKIGAQEFSCQTLNQFRNPHISISLPGKSLYEDIPFEYSAEPSKPWSCAMIHKIHDPAIPVHDYYDISIRIDSACKAKAAELFIVKLNKNNRPVYVGGEIDGQFIKARVRDFGNYTLMADSSAPKIKAVNIINGKNLQNQKTIEMTISDDLSGINKYNGYLNGQWILMDFDGKNSLLRYDFDDRLKSGKNLFKLEVTDNAGNKGVYEATLNY